MFNFNKEEFEKICQIKIDKVDLFVEAMTHRSYLNENKDHHFPHNERLEFLGDAVLELVVTEHLFDNFKNPEGEMTAWRASLVNGEMLAKIAREMDIDPFLMMSKGEAKDTGRARNYLLANAVEAIIGALYKDQGYDEARKFVERFIIVRLKEVLEKKLYLDPKSYFQEKAQEVENITPHYEVLGETGPDHDKKYLVGVFLNKEKVAEGEGISKQDAQRSAAAAGLEAKGWV